MHRILFADFCISAKLLSETGGSFNDKRQKKQLHKQAGEYLVAAELLRRDVVATTFTGNMPDFDILAANRNNKTFLIQVKTIRPGSWQLNASDFLMLTQN